MDRNKAIKSLLALGDFFGALKDKNEVLEEAEAENPWFTKDHVRKMIDSFLPWLEVENIIQFVDRYPKPKTSKRVGLVLAGNIPLVGFHDVMCTVLSGNGALIKLSSKDSILMKKVIEELHRIEPDLQESMVISEKLKGIEAFIGTGSDNTNRYFDHYFGSIPHIFRKNRTSVGVVDQETTREELLGLGSDIFSFFGLGCRNVSKLMLEEGLEIEGLIDSFQNYSFYSDHNKYNQNYEYRRAIYLTAQQAFLDGGFFVMKNSENPFSMIGEINYEVYRDQKDLEKKMNAHKDDIQTVSGKQIPGLAFSPFGQTQFPEINDFADGVDTMAFLTDLK